MFRLSQIDEQEKRMIQGILDFLKLDSIVELNSLLKDKDIKEVLP